MASKYVPAFAEWDRRASAPKQAEVAGWPYPQYSQINEVPKFLNHEMNPIDGRRTNAPK